MKLKFLSSCGLLLLMLIHNARGQSDCRENLQQARVLFNQGYFKEASDILQWISIDKASSNCLTRDFFELQSKLLLEMKGSDEKLDSLIRLMIKEDPTNTDVNLAENSQLFYNRVKSFNVYPNVKIGLGPSLQVVKVYSKREFSPVYETSQSGNLNEVSPRPFTIAGISAFAAIYFTNFLGGKLEFQQNFPTRSQTEYSLGGSYDVEITESIYSRTFSLSGLVGLGILSKNSKLLKNIEAELGVNSFNLYSSNSRYELSYNAGENNSTIYTNEVDTSPYRRNLVNSVLIGFQYAPENFISNRRIKMILSIKYLKGLSDFNRVTKRNDNQVSTLLYYYAEDRMKMNSVQFQLQLAYNVHYFKDKRK